MVLALVTLLVAVAVGAARGGSLQRLGTLPLRRTWSIGGAVLAQLLGTVIGGPAFALGLIASAVLVARFLLANRAVRGTGLLALGVLCNALVITANGAMPVSLHAAARAGTTTQDIVSGADQRHELADRDTRLPWLGDVVPAPWPVRPEVVSPGDVLIAAGLGQLVVVGMLLGPRRARHARARRRTSPAAPVRPW